MKWEGNSNPALVEAIVASFREPPDRSPLRKFTSRDWARTELWLDFSGLALYFIDRPPLHGLSDTIDKRTRHSLKQKLADNRNRTAAMYQEFVAINRLFEAAGLRYANLKGFTLAPDSCPDITLRHLSDYDFLIDPAHLKMARVLLERRGYVLTGATPRTLEFKSGSPQKVGFEGRYKAPQSKSVELHIALESTSSSAQATVCDERLHRLANWTCDAGRFPALSSADQLIGQALHLLGHLRTEHTRLSWLLEYRRHVMARKDEVSFWKEVHTLASSHPDARIALGLSTLLATDLFGAFSAPHLDSWTLNVLPPAIELWATRYGRRSVLADLPGTKLYLLLDMALAQTRHPQQPQSQRFRLVPLRPPPRILRPPPQDTILLRAQRELVQLRYIIYRLRFHIKQGVIHAVESRRWKKLLQALGHEAPRSSPLECSPIGWHDDVHTTTDLH